MEYGPPWTFQQSSLPEHKQNFWGILAFVVPSLITTSIHLMEYCFLQWFSYKKHETKQGLSYTMMLEKGENLVRELRSALAFMQGLEDRRGQF
jgi:hypothetical protein